MLSLEVNKKIYMNCRQVCISPSCK